jgi:hypothetical protein
MRAGEVRSACRGGGVAARMVVVKVVVVKVVVVKVVVTVSESVRRTSRCGDGGAVRGALRARRRARRGTREQQSAASPSPAARCAAPPRSAASAETRRSGAAPAAAAASAPSLTLLCRFTDGCRGARFRSACGASERRHRTALPPSATGRGRVSRLALRREREGHERAQVLPLSAPLPSWRRGALWLRAAP